MKLSTISFILFFCVAAFAQPSIDFISNLDEHHAAGYNDIWGYVDGTGREYALLCAESGLAVIDLDDPANPVEVAFIPGTVSVWRDVKVHGTYAYVVSDQTNDGLQIVDLSMLPDTAVLVNQLNTWFDRCHNIYIDNGYAYAVGTEGGGGMHILDLSDPVNPVRTDYYTESNYIHDVYVWNDTAYASAGSFTGSENVYAVVDLTDKSNPQEVSTSTPIPGSYAHQGWLTEDKRYFIATDEFNVRDIMVFDLQDRSTWDLVMPEWQMNSVSRVHNAMVLGDYLHIAYYEDGYVVLDISDPLNPEFAAQYDTHTPSPGGNYRGAWGVYPYLPSGLTLISDMQTGLYVLKFNDGVTSVEDEVPTEFTLNQNYPNPFNPSTKITFTLTQQEFVTLKIFNLLGEEVSNLISAELQTGVHQYNFNAANLPSGIYLARLEAGTKVKTIKMSLLK